MGKKIIRLKHSLKRMFCKHNWRPHYLNPYPKYSPRLRRVCRKCARIEAIYTENHLEDVKDE